MTKNKTILLLIIILASFMAFLCLKNNKDTGLNKIELKVDTKLEITEIKIDEELSDEDGICYSVRCKRKSDSFKFFYFTNKPSLSDQILKDITHERYIDLINNLPSIFDQIEKDVAKEAKKYDLYQRANFNFEELRGKYSFTFIYFYEKSKTYTILIMGESTEGMDISIECDSKFKVTESAQLEG